MCGILGQFGLNNSDLSRESIQHRGRDNTTTEDRGSLTVHHCLHAVQGHVEQPFYDPLFLTNCEVYNADSLHRGGRNDAEQLHNYLRDNGVSSESLAQIDGVYAFTRYEDKVITLARDILGVKPLWYYHGDDGFAFASEKKALLQADLDETKISELNPRHIVRYDTETKTLRREKRPFDIIDTQPDRYDADKDDTTKLIEQAILKRVPSDVDIGLLFSGGVDSALIAHVLNKHGVEFTAYYGGVKGSQEAEKARRVAGELGISLETATVDVEQRFDTVTEIIDDAHYLKASVALAYDAACRTANEDGCKVILSGTGAEEIFGGYHRLRSTNEVNDECRSGLRAKYYEDLYRDDTITMHHGLELRAPYLDHGLVDHAMNIPHARKGITSKQVLRDAARQLGLPSDVCGQRKKATQYGAGTANALKDLADTDDVHVGDFLAQHSDKPNTRVATLLSTGKDSCLATQRMMDYNYDVTCFATLKPAEKHSWMSHDANTSLAELQARAAGKPLLVEESSGEKEVELADYKSVLRRARDQHGVEGVVTGAVASEYQRQRIERVCERLGLKAYAPLWHTPGDGVLKQLLKRGFRVIFEKTAAAGLDEDLVGSEIKPHTIEDLRAINDEYGVHLAGEGGEFETVVLDAPFFDKEISLESTRTVSQGRNHELIVEEATLRSKS